MSATKEMEEDLLEIYDEVRECDYKGEHYSVRDNGAIMRHPNGRKRPKDNIWTFGTKSERDGYMLFSGARVHIIVATAFHGENDSTKMVVDHIDTNRCNNRPENLRWLTRLENILLNEYTRAKVEYICGSIENFLNNPQLLYGHEHEDANFIWMRAVTKEEAANTLKNLDKLIARKKPMVTLPNGNKVGEWIYESWQEKKRSSLEIALRPSRKGESAVSEEPKPEPVPEPFPTARPLAFQFGWAPYTNVDFPSCPDSVSDNPLLDYQNNLKVGEAFVSASYGVSTTFESTIYKDKLLVITKIEGGVKNFGLTRVEWDGSRFVHFSLGTFFEENGVRASYVREQDQVWDGPDSIDDYC